MNTEKTYTAANRYVLIIDTLDGKKYYHSYNGKDNLFIEINKDEDAKKTQLCVIDTFTSQIESEEMLGELKGFKSGIKRAQIRYRANNQSKLLAPVFDDKDLTYVASTLVNGEVNIHDPKIKVLIRKIYNEMYNPNHEFIDLLVRNKGVNLNEKVGSLLIDIRAHANAIRQKEKYGYKMTNEYEDDKSALFMDFLVRVKEYRTFRSIERAYKGYMPKPEKVKEKQIVEEQTKREEPIQKLAKVRPIEAKQITFDDILNGNN